MKVHRLANNVSASGAQTSVNTNPIPISKSGVFQVNISGTATVALEGRINSNHDWEVINTYTSSSLENVTITPEMRVNVTAYTSGAIYADLGV